jgi:hypothetical protein
MAVSSAEMRSVMTLSGGSRSNARTPRDQGAKLRLTDLLRDETRPDDPIGIKCGASLL